jgi:hypothetical protein
VLEGLAIRTRQNFKIGSSICQCIKKEVQMIIWLAIGTYQMDNKRDRIMKNGRAIVA